MIRTLPLLAAVFLGTGPAHAGPGPLVWFDFENGLGNTGSLGGAAEFKVYATGEEAAYDEGPFGRCLDLTAASRHGGTGAKEAPAGAAGVFRHPKLDELDTFTLVLWSRQSPLAQGQNPRLLSKNGSWDVMPAGAGVALGLGPGSSKTTYLLNDKTRVRQDEWRFRAIVASADTVCAYGGGLEGTLVKCGEKPRTEHKAAAPGELVLGTLGGIRPFNGWLDRVRVYAEALDEQALREIHGADAAAAKVVAYPQVFDLAPPPVQSRRFHLQRSDIPFSVRWQKRAEAPEIMESFHATQCLWVYGTDKTFIDRIKAKGIGYQGTLNGLQGNEHATAGRAARGDPSGRHEDLDGNKNTPSWMVTFGPKTFTGCCNHPAFRKLFFDAAKQHVDAGVDMLHVDDWAMNASWVLHGGVCFCEACRAGFREWLRTRCTPAELRRLGVADLEAFDYREHLQRNGVPDAARYREKFRDLPLTPQFTDFQVESMRGFFREFRRRLDEWSPRKYIPVSVNALLTHLHPNSNLCGVDVVDFFTGESSQDAEHQTATEYVFAAKAAEAFGMALVVSPIPRSTARTRAALATTYALGQLHLVPWDIYMGSDETGVQPRYFGNREQYGDLYDFIHAHPQLLNPFEPAAELAVVANADLPETGSLLAFCSGLAALQLPFRLILGANRSARVPVRAADLRGARVVIEYSPSGSFCEEDRKAIESVRQSGLVRFVPPGADLRALTKLRGLDLLRVEGPEKVYAFLRVNPATRSAAIHVVNWNFGESAERAEVYRDVTVTLLQPRRWGKIGSAVWLEPGRDPAVLAPERHEDCVRLTLPQLGTWGVLEVR